MILVRPVVQKILIIGFAFVVFPAAYAQISPQTVDDMIPPPLPDSAPVSSGIQMVDGLAPEQQILMQVSEEMRLELERLDKLDKGLPSLFFNKTEQVTLQDAIAKYESGEFNKDGIPEPDNSKTALDIFDYVREITLGGIMLRGEGDWVVWLNKQRLTPDRLPREVKSIRVYKEFVELKWYDEQNDRIVPVRLRPNQRFNLDSRTFLPG